jgi:hypothetical protein
MMNEMLANIKLKGKVIKWNVWKKYTDDQNRWIGDQMKKYMTRSTQSKYTVDHRKYLS